MALIPFFSALLYCFRANYYFLFLAFILLSFTFIPFTKPFYHHSLSHSLFSLSLLLNQILFITYHVKKIITFNKFFSIFLLLHIHPTFTFYLNFSFLLFSSFMTFIFVLQFPALIYLSPRLIFPFTITSFSSTTSVFCFFFLFREWMSCTSHTHLHTHANARTLTYFPCFIMHNGHR